jgi:hypothetical protein
VKTRTSGSSAADNPNVKVIMDRRHGERRTDRTGGGERQTRDRRRRRAPGSFDI